MSLPSSWRVARLADVATKPQYGWTSRAKPDADGLPLLRTTDITRGPINWPEVPRAVENPKDPARYLLNTGDIVVSRAGSVGVSALIDAPPEAVFASYLMRVRPGPELDARYLALFLTSSAYWRQITEVADGIAMPNINGTKLGNVDVPVPPLDEQRRIVDILEDHLSRLDAADNYLNASRRRLEAMVSSVIIGLIPDEGAYPDSWRRMTVAEAGKVELGRQRHPDWHTGPNMKPYLRVANVFEDRIDVTDVKEMHWPKETFERFRLHPGDVLLNEGQTPDLLGRPAIYHGEPAEVAFTNSLLRFKASDDVLPEFALLVFRRHMRAGRFKRESRITTNIAHLSARRLKPLEFPVPPLDVQRRIVEAADEQLAAIERLRGQVVEAGRRQASLRRALLAAAFAGRLTGRASDLSAAEEMIGA